MDTNAFPVVESDKQPNIKKIVWVKMQQLLTGHHITGW